MRRAVVDLGTNSALLLVAEAGRRSEPRVLLDLCTIVRLGEGVDAARRLSPAAKERTLTCLKEYALRAHSLGAGRLCIVGTSVLRDAADRDVFCESIRRFTGGDVRVLSGEEEAELSFRGAALGLALTGEILVVDVGGGSTEVVAGSVPGGPRARGSLELGAVRLTERHLRRDPPAAAEMAALEDAVREELARAAPPVQPGARAVAVAGTATTLAAIRLGLGEYDGARVHGHTLSRDEAAGLRAHLAALPLEARRNVVGLHSRRADVIVAGATVLVGLLDHYGCASVTVSDRGLRYGVLMERG
jgi:exopolyphosphatase/guanosine-5'-triphosphate,3'-diphosphate pyrophosphatase